MNEPIAPPHWYSRGYIPHCDRYDRPQFITYRLADSLPRHAVHQILAGAKDDAQKRAAYHRYLDAGYGKCWLAKPEFAETVIENWKYHNDKRYTLLDWVVMPNHVHVSYDKPTVQLSTILNGWKSYTSQKLKPLTDLKKEEPFWKRGYFDRFIRNERHLSNVQRYIFLNPVRAGLVDDPFDWPWSSIQQYQDRRAEVYSWLGIGR